MGMTRTLAPWNIVESKPILESDQTVLSVVGADDTTVAIPVFNPNDANLIAAAPELYDALVALSECEGFCWCFGCTDKRNADDICVVARNAIAKAKSWATKR